MNIKAVIFDADGMVIHDTIWFSKRLVSEYGIKEELILPFFKNEFQDCLVGKADLKDELKKYIPQWGWPGTVDDLLEAWFKSEANTDERVLSVARDLIAKGINCSLATNNEKYRTNYIVEQMGFGKVFDKVYSSPVIGHKKPEQEFYQYIVDDLQLNKDEVVFWDDEAKEMEELKKQGFMIEKYTDFESFKNKVLE